jgi:hypothetical protein
MNKNKMKAISEAYERIQGIEKDIQIIQATAERLLDKSTNVWISMDLEDDLIEEMQTTTWTSTTASGTFFMSTDTKQETEDNGLSLDMPDTVALEVLGVLLRYKQQLIQNENNNI